MQILPCKKRVHFDFQGSVSGKMYRLILKMLLMEVVSGLDLTGMDNLTIINNTTYRSVSRNVKNIGHLSCHKTGRRVQ